ncbi:TetR/AcrR family transcriptional regulator [Streptomyces sp. V4-01]|uniref:TetR/AcrR family transcriptional regulator n=1 Tax=Actinacidiphila polyblastidii TaxID=3110430 RepID=A0ABU7PK73_9ACTN|nr:TetR/AcrR family transcriptional regulator [Streptomyces sp. V4-01]
MAAARTGSGSRQGAAGPAAAAARGGVAPVAGRRQRERSDATVEDLLAAARALFAAEGYTAASLDAVCERAGVTKGALYHHFAGKRQLFGAVYAREQQRLADTVTAAYLREDDPWEAVFQGGRAYLEASLDPEVQRITLFDAPGAVGWEAMRELGVNCRDLTLRGIARAIRRGAIAPRPAEPLTSILYGGLSESAMAIARADDPREALQEALADLRVLFDALATGA